MHGATNYSSCCPKSSTTFNSQVPAALATAFCMMPDASHNDIDRLVKNTQNNYHIFVDSNQITRISIYGLYGLCCYRISIRGLYGLYCSIILCAYGSN